MKKRKKRRRLIRFDCNKKPREHQLSNQENAVYFLFVFFHPRSIFFLFKFNYPHQDGASTFQTQTLMHKKKLGFRCKYVIHIEFLHKANSDANSRINGKCKKLLYVDCSALVFFSLPLSLNFSWMCDVGFFFILHSLVAVVLLRTSAENQFRAKACMSLT